MSDPQAASAPPALPPGGADIERLRRTRDNLLKSGMYRADDRVPALLAEKMRSLMQT